MKSAAAVTARQADVMLALPVIRLDASDARNRTMLEISSDSSRRAIGVESIERADTSGSRDRRTH